MRATVGCSREPRFRTLRRIFLVAFFGGDGAGIFGGGVPGVANQIGSFFLSPLTLVWARGDLLVWPLAFMLVSHGVAFVTDFLASGEYRTANVRELMPRPYARVVVLHVTIVLGGFLATFLGPSQGVLLLFVLVKVIVDVTAYLRVRRVESGTVRQYADATG